MKILQTVIFVIIAIACSVASLFLYLLWTTRSVEVAVPYPATSLDVLAINMTILQIVLALVGFLIAIVGLFGYAGIKSATIDAAEIEARKVANEQMVKWRSEQEAKAKDLQSESAGDFASEEAPTGAAVRAAEDE